MEAMESAVLPPKLTKILGLNLFGAKTAKFQLKNCMKTPGLQRIIKLKIPTVLLKKHINQFNVHQPRVMINAKTHG